MMLAFKLSTAAALILVAMNGVSADASSVLDDCKKTVAGDDLQSAIAACALAQRMAETAEARATAAALIAQAQALLAGVKRSPQIYDYQMVIDPDAQGRPGLHALKRRMDDAMVIDPETIQPGVAYP